MVLSLGLGLATLVLGLAFVHLLRHAFRRTPRIASVMRRARRPAYLAVLVLACHVTIARLPAARWHQAANHALSLADIAVAAWCVGIALMIAIDLALPRFRTDVRENLVARRVHTQTDAVRRITIVSLAVLAIGAMLLTFPTFRAAGASLLASAGIAGVIAGFAAQSVLGNVIAGVQLVFSDALRLDDVVVVEEEWGRVEEITLTWVVIRVWDDRRLVLPTSYFLRTPFENWTRTEAAVLGSVELEMDWSVPVQAVRERLALILSTNQRWDGRTGQLQVTDATSGGIRLRALVSAADAPTLWDLRCDVREALVEWLRDVHPAALPRFRVDALPRVRVDPARTDGQARTDA
jgi:small-conductance mechanosensitive channel